MCDENYVDDSRDGDTGASRVKIPVRGQPLAPDSVENGFPEDEDERIEVLRQQYKESQKQFWNKSRLLAKTVRMAMLILSFLLMIFLTDRILTFIGLVDQLPGLLRWVAWSFVGVLCLLFISLLYTIVRNILSLKTSEPEEVKWAILVDKEKGYPVAKKYWEKVEAASKLSLERYNPKDTELERLQLECLAYDAGPKIWLEYYDNVFLRELDDRAAACISRVAKSVGVLTASNPINLVDQITIITHSLALTKELMELYGLRPKFGDVLLTMLSILTHTASSEIIQDSSEDAINFAANEFLKLIGEHVPGVATEIAGSTILKKIGGKAMEGFINFLIMKRLGRRLQKNIRPIPVGVL